MMYPNLCIPFKVNLMFLTKQFQQLMYKDKYNISYVRQFQFTNIDEIEFKIWFVYVNLD